MNIARDYIKFRRGSADASRAGPSPSHVGCNLPTLLVSGGPSQNQHHSGHSGRPIWPSHSAEIPKREALMSVPLAFSAAKAKCT